MDIINHSLCNLIIGAPADITDGTCQGLPVHQYLDAQEKLWALSFWKPEPEDLAILNAGGTIALHVRAGGRQHPVVAMGTQPKEEN